MSNIIKQFKLSCSKTQAHFATMQARPTRGLGAASARPWRRRDAHTTRAAPPPQVRNARYSAFIEGFTSTTYAMVIVSDPAIQPATTLINIEASHAHFEALISNLGFS